VRYENGQTEDIRIETPAEARLSQEELDDLRSTDHYRIAKTTVAIAARMVDIGEHGEAGQKLGFTSILGLANSILVDMDDIARTWGYPVDPDPVEVAVQNSYAIVVQHLDALSRLLGHSHALWVVSS